MHTFVKLSSVYFFNATVLGEVGVVKDFRGLGVDGVVDGKLDAVNQGIDFVELVQPHVDLPVDVFLEFVSAAWWQTKEVECVGGQIAQMWRSCSAPWFDSQSSQEFFS